MEMNGLTGGIYRALDWVAKIAYLNILWIGFSIFGLIVFGIFPATAAMFAVTRKWVQGEESVSIFPTFWTAYKREFVKVNILGLVLTIIGAIIYLDIMILSGIEHLAVQIVRYVLIGLAVLYGMTILTIFPVFVHYKLRTFQYIKYAFLISMTHPFRTLVLASIVAVLYIAVLAFPGIIPFFTGSIFSYMAMWATYDIFKKIEEQKKLVEEQSKE